MMRIPAESSVQVTTHIVFCVSLSLRLSLSQSPVHMWSVCACHLYVCVDLCGVHNAHMCALWTLTMCILSQSFFLLFERFSHWTWSSLVCLDWLGSKLQERANLDLPVMGLQALAAQPMDAEDPNSGCHVCMANTFLSDTSLQFVLDF